jgi:transketolase
MASKANEGQLAKIATLMRYYILKMTSHAGSGHPTSSLSATELMCGLFFGGYFRFDPDRPDHPNNDRLIFSKGHASPLLYALWAAAGSISEEEIMTYRSFGSPLEGHPTPRFRYADAATGSLGQGLSIGVGMAINAKYLDKLPYRTFVLLGDSEMAEGSQWEAIQLAAHYKLNNLIGIIDVNRLGQRGPTMYGHDIEAYGKRASAFGWEPILIDGHAFPEICDAYEKAFQSTDRPVMIIARTIKGKGVSFVEDKNGFHGKPIEAEDLDRALAGLGEIDRSVRGELHRPEDRHPAEMSSHSRKAEPPDYPRGKPVATRNAYGNGLKHVYAQFPDIVSLDGEVSNSTHADLFKEARPDRFFEMYIAEQNMLGTALGLQCRGKIPFASSFAAFLTRAFDQIRMSRYSNANIKIVGSHAGVSIGQDGPSQMGLEDIAMFRTILDGVVLYPCDAVSTEKLVAQAAGHRGVVYIRTTRGKTPVIYGPDEEFPIGGCKVLRKSNDDAATVIGAGITLHEALKAYDELAGTGLHVRVIDLYSIKPLDMKALREAAEATSFIITVEDHYAEGGIGEAVRSALGTIAIPVYPLAVRKMPKSGSPEELLDFEEISSRAIVRKVKEVLER